MRLNSAIAMVEGVEGFIGCLAKVWVGEKVKLCVKGVNWPPRRSHHVHLMDGACLCPQTKLQPNPCCRCVDWVQVFWMPQFGGW
jgi:hypothetical protein